MKIFRPLLPIAIATLLTACGGSNLDDGSTQTTVAMAQTVAVPAQASNQADPYVTPIPPASANMPQPDCAADGCKSVRIIDSNVEVAHLAAVRRAEQEAGQPGA